MLSTAACHTVFLADLSHLIFEEVTVACQTDPPTTGNVITREMYVFLTGTGPIDLVISCAKDHLSASIRNSKLRGHKTRNAIVCHLIGGPSTHWVVCPRMIDMVP